MNEDDVALCIRILNAQIAGLTTLLEKSTKDIEALEKRVAELEQRK